MRVQHVENAVKGLLLEEHFPGTPYLFKRHRQVAGHLKSRYVRA
jgi:hypothetical protein